MKWRKYATGSRFSFAHDGDGVLVRDDRSGETVARIGSDRQIYTKDTDHGLSDADLADITSNAQPFMIGVGG